ncbi:MAG: hypothetical protein Kow0037_02510 [Calditrichia bacterium]
MKRIYILFIACVLVLGCQHTHDHEPLHSEKEHEHHEITVTLWGKEFELFLEHEPLVFNEPMEFLIHLTDLKLNKPLSKGEVRLTFSQNGTNPIFFNITRPSQPGIFKVLVEKLPPGDYQLNVAVKDGDRSESFWLGEVRVAAEHSDIHQAEVPEAEEDGIRFLKEQQWQADFRCDTVGMRLIREMLPAVGEVLPRQNGFAEIISPVAGLLTLDHNQNMVLPGTKVKKGQTLLTICPPPGGENSWTDTQLAYQKAKADFERAKRLLEKDAISRREFEDIRRQFLVHQAGFEALKRLTNSEETGDPFNTETHFILKSPINGVVANVEAYPGSRVETGQPLLQVIDPSRVWVRVDLFEKDYYHFSSLHGLEISLPGSSTPLRLKEGQWKLINTGSILNTQSRTIPLLIEVNNEDNLLKIGQNFPVNLITGPLRKVLTVPHDAVIDEDFQKVVFVQKSGELFEKRVVRTGAASDGYIEIKAGLKPGERVVSRGAYLVKLASNTTSIGHPHSH